LGSFISDVLFFKRVSPLRCDFAGNHSPNHVGILLDPFRTAEFTPMEPKLKNSIDEKAWDREPSERRVSIRKRASGTFKSPQTELSGAFFPEGPA
jgi:hypothetical protein